jgi:hypothetical protein
MGRFLLFLIFIFGVLALCRRSSEIPSLPASAPVVSHVVDFHLKNDSQAQPKNDLAVWWDERVVAVDTLEYRPNSKGMQHYQLAASAGEHRLRVVNNLNHLAVDTTVLVQEPETNVFITFAYRPILLPQLERIKASKPIEGVAAVVAALEEPKTIVVHVAHGPIFPVD